MKVWALIFIMLFTSLTIEGQEDLLERIDKTDTLPVAEAAFKGVKIVNLESTRLVNKKELYFVVSHRFGSVQNGFEDFFGLDNANTRLQFIYGISDAFNVSLSRHSFNKSYESFLKYRILQQGARSPLTVVGFSQATINTFINENLLLEEVDLGDRITVTQQMLLSRKFNERLSLQLAPTYFYEGYVDFPSQQPSQFALGIGGRYKLGDRWAINMDYGWHLNRATGSPFVNPLSVGVAIETGGHVFQLHFTNAQSTFESGFLGNAVGDWSEGNIYFGFNLTRVFNL